jgi:hypothetical protein
MLHGVDIQPPSSRFSKSVGHQHVLEPGMRTTDGAKISPSTCSRKPPNAALATSTDAAWAYTFRGLPISAAGGMKSPSSRRATPAFCSFAWNNSGYGGRATSRYPSASCFSTWFRPDSINAIVDAPPVAFRREQLEPASSWERVKLSIFWPELSSGGA